MNNQENPIEIKIKYYIRSMIGMNGRENSKRSIYARIDYNTWTTGKTLMCAPP